MKRDGGLKGRFLAATLSLAVVFVGGYTLAVSQLIEVVEVAFATRSFEGYLDAVIDSWGATPPRRLDLPTGVQAFVVVDGEHSALPPALRHLGSGVHLEVDVNGTEMTVARRDVAGRRFIVAANSALDPVEYIERELLRIATAVGAAALVIAVLMAFWLARVVMRPVQALALATSAIVPGDVRQPLASADAESEIRLIAQAFERTLDRYDEIVERERAFTRDASHELRTPLAVILTSLELLEAKSELPVALRARLARIRAAAEQMRMLTEGLLFLARPPETGAAPSCVVDVGAVVRDAIRIHHLDNELPPVEMRLETEAPCLVDAPSGLLLCVVGNLLRNAQEHAAGSAIEICIGMQMLAVSDHGAGIAVDVATQLFERHVRGENSAGEGLGLDIVKRICTRLGWRIEVDSLPGLGARFTLYFA